MTNKDKNSWLPNTNKSMFPDTWKENLAKSVNEQDVTRPRMPRNAPTFRPDLRNPDLGLNFDRSREERERLFDDLTHIFRALALMK